MPETVATVETNLQKDPQPIPQEADTADAIKKAPTPSKPRPRSLGIPFGIFTPGPLNAITDVPGVSVGQITLEDNDKGIHTGVTAIRPHEGNVFLEKVPAGIFLGNGFGKMTGFAQVRELGNLETPIVLTNTLAVGPALKGLVDWTLAQPGCEAIKSVNGVVGETNDGRVNAIRECVITPDHVRAALDVANAGPIDEGCVGAGTGTVAFGYKAGIGSASRVLPENCGGWHVGVLVQANFGGILTVSGVPVGLELGGWPCEKELGQTPEAQRMKSLLGTSIETADGSIMMVVATDAPLDARNCRRLAERAFMGMTRTGGVASNGSGDFAIAFSTAPSVRVHHESTNLLEGAPTVRNDAMTPLFMAAIEATEEAIINALFAAHAVTTTDGTMYEALPIEKVLALLRAHGVIERPKAESEAKAPQQKDASSWFAKAFEFFKGRN